MMTWSQIKAALKSFAEEYIEDLKAGEEPKSKGKQNLEEDGDIAADFMVFLKSQFPNMKIKRKSAKKGRKSKK
jgi:50S ribosomal subunit-associated GTPase HflX